MLTGFKGWIDGYYFIKVDGFRSTRYLYYSTREAESKYRHDNGLTGRKIKWREG